MHWIITKDLINTHDGGESKVNRMRGPKEMCALLPTLSPLQKQVAFELFRDTMNFEFRLFDDDGILYYEGMCRNLDTASGDKAFAPLDWAARNDGATRMDYRKKGEETWQTL